MDTPCPRCGKPVKGLGKSPYCQPCATAIYNTKNKYWMNMTGRRPRQKRQRLRPTIPITLSKP